MAENDANTSTPVGNLPEIVENIIWHLDAQSILRAKQVCCLWKKTIEHLEQCKQLWRHVCLRDIHRASLIDIVGFNPLSRTINNKTSDGRHLEDLWRNVYMSWRAGQYLDRCKETYIDLDHTMLDRVYVDIVQIGAYIYMLQGNRLDLWNIDAGHQVMFSQNFKGELRGKFYLHLQNPLCKFSQHQHLTQHSLIIPTADSIQWWTFSNEKFNLAKTLVTEFHGMSVWDNLLVLIYKNAMTVFILETLENEFNFRKRNVSDEFLNVNWGSMKIYDNRCLFRTLPNSSSIVVYSLDDFSQHACISCEASISPRIFGDFLLMTTYDEDYVKSWLCVCNIQTGEKIRMKVFGNDVTNFTLHGDLLIAEQAWLNMVHICRINLTGCTDPVWCSDGAQIRISGEDTEQSISDELKVVAPKFIKSEKHSRFQKYKISYGESLVFFRRKFRSHAFSVKQYVYR